jgi:hypothetical protein
MKIQPLPAPAAIKSKIENLNSKMPQKGRLTPDTLCPPIHSENMNASRKNCELIGRATKSSTSIRGHKGTAPGKNIFNYFSDCEAPHKVCAPIRGRMNIQSCSSSWLAHVPLPRSAAVLAPRPHQTHRFMKKTPNYFWTCAAVHSLCDPIQVEDETPRRHHLTPLLTNSAPTNS